MSTPDQSIDITAEVCPMTFVRTKLKLERMRSGEVLSVRLRGEAIGMRAGFERDQLLRKARQAETASHMSAWLRSPGLRPPE